MVPINGPWPRHSSGVDDVFHHRASDRSGCAPGRLPRLVPHAARGRSLSQRVRTSRVSARPQQPMSPRPRSRRRRNDPATAESRVPMNAEADRPAMRPPDAGPPRRLPGRWLIEIIISCSGKRGRRSRPVGPRERSPARPNPRRPSSRPGHHRPDRAGPASAIA
jgi:hypothetical protein